jgi:flagellar FliJ protein
MKRQFPLQTLLDLSHLRLDEAARKLGELIAGEKEASQRHVLLVQYRAEYRERFVAATQEGLAAREWQNYSSFLARLDEAISQAEAAIQHSQMQTAHGQKEWLTKRGRVKAFSTLSDRHDSRIAQHDRRKEQKDSDEHSARRDKEIKGNTQ